MRENFSGNSPYEPTVGFSRAVKVGTNVYVSGTVGRGKDGKVVFGGVYDQAKQAIANIAAALEQAGASLTDVVRTRIYLVDIDEQDELARAHREAFGDIRPASTMVEVAALATPEMLVEIEADAVIGADPSP
jgi:enamine deaminase RidA (YjgF/YER057c/UK114 family)